MLSLTRKCDYALLAMVELAHCDAKLASARGIASVIGVPLPVLTNVLHLLVQCGLVASRKGAHGGYALARGPDDINLADIIDGVEGPGRLTMCCAPEIDDSEEDCTLTDSCRLKRPIRKVHEGIREYLCGVSLSELAFEREIVELSLPERSG